MSARGASAFVAHCLDLLSGVGPARARAMMGGHMLYVGALPVGLVWDDRLYLKADGEEAPAFARAGGEPFTYELRGRVVEMSFWSAPDAALDDPESMRPWAERALAAARRAAARKAARAGAKRSTSEAAAQRSAASKRKPAAPRATGRGTSGTRRPSPRRRSRSSS